MKLKGTGYQGIAQGSFADAMTALTGVNYAAIALAGHTNQEIGQLIAEELEANGPVAIGTIDPGLGKKNGIPLSPKPGNLYFDHAYVVESVVTDADGNVMAVMLLNPWGLGRATTTKSRFRYRTLAAISATCSVGPKKRSERCHSRTGLPRRPRWPLPHYQSPRPRPSQT